MAVTDPAHEALERGLTLVRESRRPMEAVAALQEAVRLRPGLARAHEGLADALCQAGSEEAAIAAYREAIRLEPGNLRLYLELGVLLELTRQWEEEVAVYQAALQLA